MHCIQLHLLLRMFANSFCEDMQMNLRFLGKLLCVYGNIEPLSTVNTESTIVLATENSNSIDPSSSTRKTANRTSSKASTKQMTKCSAHENISHFDFHECCSAQLTIEEICFIIFMYPTFIQYVRCCRVKKWTQVYIM